MARKPIDRQSAAYKKSQKRALKFFGITSGLLLFVIIIVGLAGGSAPESSTDYIPNQQQEEVATQAKAAARQAFINTNGPVYCANHQDVKLNSPDLTSQGWPFADNKYGVTQEQCSTIVGKLYDLRDGSEYRESMVKAVAEKKIAIGMTRAEAVFSLGTPRTVNNTTTSNGTHEQWVYSLTNYVYVDDGIVTSYQD
jgi:type II secretory pathway pseudopilin PulG